MKPRYDWALAIAGVTLLSWTSFNIGFDLGSDTAACIAFHLADEKEIADPFCERGTSSKSPGMHAVRRTWLAAHGKEPAA